MNKKKISILFFMFIASFVFCEKYKITQDANMREKPNKDSAVILVIPKDTICDTNMNESNWCLVSFNEKQGYVHKSLLKKPFKAKDLVYDIKDFLKKNPIVAGIILLIILIIILVRGIKTRCPKCKRWFARKKIKEEVLSSSGRYETKTRTDVRKDRQGNQIGTVERQEQVHMTDYFMRCHCRCKYCKHQYYYDFTKSYES